MTKTTIFKIAGMMILAFTLLSCNGLKKMAKNYDSVSYEVNPEVLEAHGGVVNFKVTGTIPAKFFNKKAAVLIQPTLQYEGGELELTPMMLIGESVDGEGTRVNYANGGTFAYDGTFGFIPEMKASELMVSAVAFMPKSAVSAGMTMEDAMKMRKATNLGEEKIADGVIATSMRIEIGNEVTELTQAGGEQVDDQYAVELLSLAPHGYEKVTIVSEEATIYYQKNLHTYNTSLEWNKKKDVVAQLDKLTNFVRQGWEIKDIQIDGWASPEGEETFNEGLSERRANTANDVVYRDFQKLVREKNSTVKFKNPKEDLNLKKIGHGPDWNGFLAAVESSSIQDKRPILNVIKSSAPDKREEEIRNMINIYPELEESILPSLRRAAIKVNCFEPKKTDEEIARLATTSPGELSEAELLYGATLTKDWNTKYNIYKSATKNFPNSYKGFNNAGYMALKLGKTDEAVEYLSQAEKLNKNSGEIANNLGVAHAINNDFNEAEKNFLNANKMGVDNNYNLALIDIKRGSYDAAIKKMSGVKCNYNAGLAYLLAGNNPAATQQLECARKNAATYYLMAVAGARTNNQAMMMSNLEKAIAADKKYKMCAGVDREFISYYENQDFQGLVK